MLEPAVVGTSVSEMNMMQSASFVLQTVLSVLSVPFGPPPGVNLNTDPSYVTIPCKVWCAVQLC